MITAPCSEQSHARIATITTAFIQNTRPHVPDGYELIWVKDCKGTTDDMGKFKYRLIKDPNILIECDTKVAHCSRCKALITFTGHIPKKVQMGHLIFFGVSNIEGAGV